MDPAQSEWLCRELGYVLSAAAAEFNEKQPTLRDQFATAALSGLLASPHSDSYQFPPYAHQQPAQVAKEAYELADAMLAAREPKVEAT